MRLRALSAEDIGAIEVLLIDIDLIMGIQVGLQQFRTLVKCITYNSIILRQILLKKLEIRLVSPPKKLWQAICPAPFFFRS